MFVLCASSAHAEEQTYFQQKAAEKLEELQSASGAAMRGLLLYPKDIRDAILELSVHPEMIVRAYDLGEEPGEQLDQIATGYPPELRSAAATLVAERQVLGILSNNLILAGLLGAIYADDKTGVEKRVDETAAIAEKLGEEALEDWRGRIAGDEEAQKQLEAATKAYQLEVAPNDKTQITTSSGDTVNVNVNVDSSSGYQTSSSGAIIIYSAPSYSYSVYVMNHCNLYYSVCGHMHYHSVSYGHYYDDYWDDYWDNRNDAREDWQNHLSEGREDRQQAREERGGDIAEQREARREDRSGAAESGNGGLNQAMKDWKETNGEALGGDFFKDDGKLSERFQDFGTAQREFGEELRSGKLEESDRAQALKSGLGDAQKSRTGQRERPAAQSVASQARATGSRTGSVQRGQRTRSQTIERARRSHGGSWGTSRGRSGGRSGGGFGGGGRRGGGRRR